MYNAIIGTGVFTKLIIETFILNDENVVLLSDKNNLEQFRKDTSIMKKSLDIQNSKSIRTEVLSKNYSKIIIYTDDDMLTLMLEESLRDLNNVYVIFNNSSINTLVSNKCTCIFIDELLKKCFNEEIL